MALSAAPNYSASPPLIVGCLAIAVLMLVLLSILLWRRVRSGQWVPAEVLINPEDYQTPQRLQQLRPRPKMWNIWTTQREDWAEERWDKSKCIATTAAMSWAHIMPLTATAVLVDEGAGTETKTCHTTSHETVPLARALGATVRTLRPYLRRYRRAHGPSLLSSSSPSSQPQPSPLPLRHEERPSQPSRPGRTIMVQIALAIAMPSAGMSSIAVDHEDRFRECALATSLVPCNVLDED